MAAPSATQHQFLPDRERYAEDLGERRPDLHGLAASNAPSATTIRSTAGPMDDYYSFAAFFSQIGRKQGEDYRETIVFNSGGGA